MESYSSLLRVLSLPGETHRRGDDTPQAAFDTVQLTVTPTVGLSELHDHPGRAGSGLSDEGTASTDRKSSSRPGHSRATALLTSKPGEPGYCSSDFGVSR